MRGQRGGELRIAEKLADREAIGDGQGIGHVEIERSAAELKIEIGETDAPGFARLRAAMMAACTASDVAPTPPPAFSTATSWPAGARRPARGPAARRDALQAKRQRRFADRRGQHIDCPALQQRPRVGKIGMAQHKNRLRRARDSACTGGPLLRSLRPTRHRRPGRECPDRPAYRAGLRPGTRNESRETGPPCRHLLRRQGACHDPQLQGMALRGLRPGKSL